MINRIRPSRLFSVAILLLASAAAVTAASLPVELQLIWATNQPKSPNPKHKPVSPDVAKLLEDSPYRWKYYFEVNRRVVEVPEDHSLEKITMSRHCALDIKYLGRESVQVKLYGDDKLVSSHKERLP